MLGGWSNWPLEGSGEKGGMIEVCLPGPHFQGGWEKVTLLVAPGDVCSGKLGLACQVVSQPGKPWLKPSLAT